MTKLPSKKIDGLRGDDLLYNNEQVIKAPGRRFTLFLSSTFTDTHTERNILGTIILPQLREQGEKAQIDVTFADLRSGIPDENTLDHLTWLGCQRELMRCHSESASLFFVSLQGNKYGYMPIPKFIDQTALDDRLAESEELPDAVKKARDWYLLDVNAVPPVYVLKNLTGSCLACPPLSTSTDKRYPLTNNSSWDHLIGDWSVDSVYWSEILPCLVDLLKGIVFDPTFPDGIIGRSVTEYEVKLAISLCEAGKTVENGKTAVHEGIRWFHRDFAGGVSKEQGNFY